MPSARDRLDSDLKNASETAVHDVQRLNASLARVLLVMIYHCACGAPFDLSAAPNFQRLISEAQFNWPPPSPIKYPAKDW